MNRNRPYFIRSFSYLPRCYYLSISQNKRAFETPTLAIRAMLAFCTLTLSKKKKCDFTQVICAPKQSKLFFLNRVDACASIFCLSCPTSCTHAIKGHKKSISGKMAPQRGGFPTYFPCAKSSETQIVLTQQNIQKRVELKVVCVQTTVIVMLSSSMRTAVLRYTIAGT